VRYPLIAVPRKIPALGAAIVRPIRTGCQAILTTSKERNVCAIQLRLRRLLSKSKVAGSVLILEGLPVD
jgi:hypothetical protein